MPTAYKVQGNSAKGSVVKLNNAETLVSLTGCSIDQAIDIVNTRPEARRKLQELMKMAASIVDADLVAPLPGATPTQAPAPTPSATPAPSAKGATPPPATKPWATWEGEARMASVEKRLELLEELVVGVTKGQEAMVAGQEAMHAWQEYMEAGQDALVEEVAALIKRFDDVTVATIAPPSTTKAPVKAPTTTTPPKASWLSRLGGSVVSGMKSLAGGIVSGGIRAAIGVMECGKAVAPVVKSVAKGVAPFTKLFTDVVVVGCSALKAAGTAIVEQVRSGRLIPTRKSLIGLALVGGAVASGIFGPALLTAWTTWVALGVCLGTVAIAARFNLLAAASCETMVAIAIGAIVLMGASFSLSGIIASAMWYLGMGILAMTVKVAIAVLVVRS